MGQIANQMLMDMILHWKARRTSRQKDKKNNQKGNDQNTKQSDCDREENGKCS